MKPALSYFYVPIAAFVVGVTAAFILAGPAVAFTVAVLAILEISLSFDNAVVNASVLQNWSPAWRSAFMGLGIIVAVFGMRLVFPIVIVTATTGLSVSEVVGLALHDQATYAKHLTAVHGLVAAFGGAFLGMVGLGFFLDDSKDSHWLGWLEKPLAKLGQIEAVHGAVVMAVVWFVSTFLPGTERMTFIVAGILGFVAFVATKAVGSLLSGGGEDSGTSKVIQAGVGGFLYLELLDASFSFDGVIGAFALSQDLVWITVGLGIGALTVRELTLLAVDRGTLAEYPYLEHGAFWAILSLSGLMMASAVTEIPESVTGLIGAGLIGAAFVTSLIKNRYSATATA